MRTKYHSRTNQGTQTRCRKSFFKYGRSHTGIHTRSWPHHRHVCICMCFAQVLSRSMPVYSPTACAAIASLGVSLWSSIAKAPQCHCECPVCAPALTCSGSPSTSTTSSVSQQLLASFFVGVLVTVCLGAALFGSSLVRSSSPGPVEESKGSKGGRGTIRSLPIIA